MHYIFFAIPDKNLTSFINITYFVTIQYTRLGMHRVPRCGTVIRRLWVSSCKRSLHSDA